jgi:hypothetical protein
MRRPRYRSLNSGGESTFLVGASGNYLHPIAPLTESRLLYCDAPSCLCRFNPECC